jgi:P27 family predicted phage terminase small subunit
MPPGRKRKPASVHIANGNPGGRPIQTEADYSAAGDIGKAPSWIDAGAKAEYKRIVAALEDLDLLRATDLGVVVSYAVAYSRWMAAEKQITKEGTVLQVMGSQGQQKFVKHPALLVSAAAQTQMLRAGSLLGLNPVDRAKISASPKQLANPFTSLLGNDDEEDSPSIN